MKRLYKFNYIYVFLLSVAPFFAFHSEAKANASIGISPPYIRSELLLPGSHFEQEMVISRSDPVENQKAVIELDVKDIGEWITFSPGTEVELPKGQNRVYVTAIVDVPQDAAFGIYTGSGVVKLISENNNGQVSILPAINISIDLTVSDKEVFAIEISSIHISDFTEGDKLPLTITIKNNGNKEDTFDQVDLVITDLQSKEVARLSYNDEAAKIEPFKTSDLTVGIENSLSKGEYFANAEIFYKNELIFSDKVVFRVNEMEIPSLSETGTKEKEDISLIKISAIILGLLVISVVSFVLLNKRKKNIKRMHKLKFEL